MFSHIYSPFDVHIKYFFFAFICKKYYYCTYGITKPQYVQLLPPGPAYLLVWISISDVGIIQHWGGYRILENGVQDTDSAPP